MLSTIFSFDQLTDKKAQNQNTTKQHHIASAGLAIYQRSLLANASRALAITFATVHSFIGEVSFTLLVKEYLQANLKDQYDWGELGRSLPAFIEQQGQKNNEVLAAIATLDFACHQSERAQDVEKDLTTLSLLSDIDAYQLSINFTAGFKVLKLNYPADSIIEKVKVAAQKNSKITIDDIALLLSEAEAETEAGEYHYLIWRPNFQAQYQQITPQEYQWLALWQSALLQPKSLPLSLGLALDDISKKQAHDKSKVDADTTDMSTADVNTAENGFSIIDWLPQAIEQQLINSISSIATAS